MILTLLQALALAATPPLNTIGTLTLAQSNDRVFVMMRIGQDEIVPMVFDTGSNGHSIDRSLVSRHRLRTVGTTIEFDGSTQKPFATDRRHSGRLAGGLRVCRNARQGQAGGAGKRCRPLPLDQFRRRRDGGRIEGRVQIGPITLDSPDVVFLGDVANVGLPVIRRGRMLLDSANHRSWFLANP